MVFFVLSVPSLWYLGISFYNLLRIPDGILLHFIFLQNLHFHSLLHLLSSPLWSIHHFIFKIGKFQKYGRWREMHLLVTLVQFYVFWQCLICLRSCTNKTYINEWWHFCNLSKLLCFKYHHNRGRICFMPQLLMQPRHMWVKIFNLPNDLKILTFIAEFYASDLLSTSR